MSPFSFPPSLAQLFAGALNALLKREPWARERLAVHSGKMVSLAVGKLAAGFTIGVDGLAQACDAAIVPDVMLTIAPEKLSLAQLRAHDDPAAAFTAVTHISGDAALAQVVSELAQHLRLDPEDELARVVGDVAAVRLVGGARAVASGACDTAARLAGNAAEYLAEESAMLVGRPRAADWQDALARTRDVCDTLAARIAKLSADIDRVLDRGANRIDRGGRGDLIDRFGGTGS